MFLSEREQCAKCELKNYKTSNPPLARLRVCMAHALCFDARLNHAKPQQARFVGAHCGAMV